MAFVHDIEADRIDDFNLFSAFVRVPLLILGGVLGGGKDGKSNSSTSATSSKDQDCDEDMDGSSSTSTIATHPMKNGLSEGDMDGDAIDCSASSSPSTARDNAKSNLDVLPQHPSNNASDTDIDETDTDGEGLKRSKKMSWSDSVGLCLVEYNDESLPPREPQHKSLQPKSALKKCRDERETAVVKKSAADAPKRYIPKMGGASINMPSFSHTGGSSPGYVSPEWGWYINTTPPTPEMYHSQSSFGASSKLTRTDGSGAPTFPFATQSASQTSGKTKPHHNQVFQNLQSNMTQNMGWTSVPI